MADYDRITYCDVVECCETCPRYGDDCDGWQYFDESCFEDDCEVAKDEGHDI